MARVVGFFENIRAVQAVVEQLEFNGLRQITILGTDHGVQDVDQQVERLGLPAPQAAEYRTRLHNQQCLLLVQARDLDLPMVQRALRTGQALDIDVLPEAMV